MVKLVINDEGPFGGPRRETPVLIHSLRLRFSSAKRIAFLRNFDLYEVFPIIFTAPLAFAFTFTLGLFAQTPPKTNLLLITVDDMSCDSVGVYGCKLKGTSPRMDRLASQSIRFDHAHVTVGNCMPCRNVMFSGLYSHNNKVEGFYQVKDPGWPHMADLLRDAGYYVAIRGKVSHSSPINPMPGTRTLRSCRTVKRLTSKTLLLTGNLPPGGLPMPKRRGSLSSFR